MWVWECFTCCIVNNIQCDKGVLIFVLSYTSSIALWFQFYHGSLFMILLGFEFYWHNQTTTRIVGLKSQDDGLLKCWLTSHLVTMWWQENTAAFVVKTEKQQLVQEIYNTIVTKVKIVENDGWHYSNVIPTAWIMHLIVIKSNLFRNQYFHCSNNILNQ